ncbi:MAG TPA: hypothetical protein VNG51_01380 [Ktedonobacteraceae bacterium]|nr:hypothetical protein [Ktedonobacteraceae bacterium]
MPRPRTRLPAGLGITEADGRFYPVYEDDDRPRTRFSWDISHTIPFAVGPRRERGSISFATRREAVWFCRRHDEDSYLLAVTCPTLLAASELYPERNAWYREEITRLVSTTEHIAPDEVFIHFYSSCLYTTAWLVNVHQQGYLALQKVRAATVDELWERLYTAVCSTLVETMESQSVLQGT